MDTSPSSAHPDPLLSQDGRLVARAIMAVAGADQAIIYRMDDGQLKMVQQIAVSSRILLKGDKLNELPSEQAVNAAKQTGIFVTSDEPPISCRAIKDKDGNVVGVLELRNAAPQILAREIAEKKQEWTDKVIIKERREYSSAKNKDSKAVEEMEVLSKYNVDIPDDKILTHGRAFTIPHQPNSVRNREILDFLWERFEPFMTGKAIPTSIIRSPGVRKHVGFLKDYSEAFKASLQSQLKDPSVLDETWLHSEKVAERFKEFAQVVALHACNQELDKNHIELMHYIGLCHDLGKVGLDNKILYKKQGEKFSDHERHAVSHHVVDSRHALNLPTVDKRISCIIGEHHQGIKGVGYPFNGGLVTRKGRREKDEAKAKAEALETLVHAKSDKYRKEIRDAHKPYAESQMLLICDIYDALTAQRAYKTAMDLDRALPILEEEVHAGLINPDFLALFIHTQMKHKAEMTPKERVLSDMQRAFPIKDMVGLDKRLSEHTFAFLDKLKTERVGSHIGSGPKPRSEQGVSL